MITLINKEINKNISSSNSKKIKNVPSQRMDTLPLIMNKQLVLKENNILPNLQERKDFPMMVHLNTLEQRKTHKLFTPDSEAESWVVLVKFNFNFVLLAFFFFFFFFFFFSFSFFFFFYFFFFFFFFFLSFPFPFPFVSCF